MEINSNLFSRCLEYVCLSFWVARPIFSGRLLLVSGSVTSPRKMSTLSHCRRCRDSEGFDPFITSFLC